MNRRFEIENGPAVDLLNVIAIGPPLFEGGSLGLYGVYPPRPHVLAFEIRFRGDPNPMRILTGYVNCRYEFSEKGWGIFKSETRRQWFDEEEVQKARDTNQRIRDELMVAWKAFHDQAD